MLSKNNWKVAAEIRSLVYRKIADGLRESGFSHTLEQCRDKIMKLKTEYKKIHDRGRLQDRGDIPVGIF